MVCLALRKYTRKQMYLLKGQHFMIMLTEAEANEIKALLIQLSREILLQGTYQRKIASCLVILSKQPAS
jgi:hypothetical protein